MPLCSFSELPVTGSHAVAWWWSGGERQPASRQQRCSDLMAATMIHLPSAQHSDAFTKGARRSRMSVCLAVSSGGDEYHLRLQPSPLCTKYTSTCTTPLHKDHSPCGPLPCHRRSFENRDDLGSLTESPSLAGNTLRWLNPRLPIPLHRRKKVPFPGMQTREEGHLS